MKSKAPKDYGFSQSASADQNVAALRKALSGGGLIVIDTPGVYKLNDTIILESNTNLLCSPGVIFQKVAPYCNVLINKGALTKEYDENITIDGLEVSVNGYEDKPALVYGLRAQLGFFYVKDLTIKNFTCVDGEGFQFLIYIVTWEHLLIENVRLAGDKDGIKLNNGHDAVINNLDLTTYDDGLSLCGTDYASVVLEVGDVYNVRYSNVTDHQYKNIFGRTCMIYTGSWADYTDGNDYQIADFCLNGGRLYQCVNGRGEASRIASSAPIHDNGVITGDDGILWRYIQNCDFHHTDVYNISFDNCIFEKSGNLIISWYVNAYIHRNYYPGTEGLSNSWGISISNCKVKAIGEQVFVCVNGNMKDVVISNCVFDGTEAIIRINASSRNNEFNASITGCVFKNIDDYLIAIHSEERVKDWALPFANPDAPNHIGASEIETDQPLPATPIKVNCHLAGNTFSDSVFRNLVLDNAKLRAINLDLPFETLDNLSPYEGDICKNRNGLHICENAVWRSL